MNTGAPKEVALAGNLRLTQHFECFVLVIFKEEIEVDKPEFPSPPKISTGVLSLEPQVLPDLPFAAFVYLAGVAFAVYQQFMDQLSLFVLMVVNLNFSEIKDMALGFFIFENFKEGLLNRPEVPF